MSKLSNVVDNDVPKKTKYDKSVAKVKAVGISGFVSKKQCNTAKLGIEKNIDDVDKKTPDTSGLVKKLVIM